MMSFCWLQLKLHYWDNESATKDGQDAHRLRYTHWRCYVKVDNGQDTQIVAPVPLFMASWFALVKWSLSWRTEEYQNDETVSHTRQHLYISLTSHFCPNCPPHFQILVSVGCLAWAELCHTLLAAEVGHVTVTGLACHSRLPVGGMAGWRARCSGLSSRVQSLISSGSRTCSSRMDTDQTSEKMLKPGRHMTHISY